MRVSVVVPVKDDERVVECVESIRVAAADGALDAEIVVVDNGSGDGFEPVLASLRDAGVRVASATGTVYAARNRGVEATSGEVLFFTDADCRVDRGWLRAGVEAIRAGADLAQGFSGSAGDSSCDRLIQGRYGSQFRHVPPGAAVECDTRNLAVRRAALQRLRFNERYRRVGDTELGLRAEALGFRVEYVPGMRVLHAHERSLELFVAKQICHGWGAQRLMREQPGLPWHGGHLRLTARLGPRLRYVPARRVIARVLARASLVAARGVERAGSRAPFRVSLAALAAADKLGGLAGHLGFTPGGQEPSPSCLLGRRLPRD